MAEIQWDASGEKLFETGLDRGVLYTDTGAGVPWNGLVSVSEAPTFGETQELFFDGVKTFDMVGVATFKGTLKAFTFPEEFLEYDGYAEASPGLVLDGQTRKTFGLSYRTLVGNDVDGTDHGYKLHIVYDLTATPQSTARNTIGAEVSALEFSWGLSATPRAAPGYRPTAHLYLDSTTISPLILSEVERILYGSSTTNSRLPTISEVLSLTTNTDTISIFDNGDGTWTAVGPDSDIVFISSTEFEIRNANASYLDSDTYQISSS